MLLSDMSFAQDHLTLMSTNDNPRLICAQRDWLAQQRLLGNHLLNGRFLKKGPLRSLEMARFRPKAHNRL
jgi:hypothetical protein